MDTLKNILRSPASKEADEGEVQEMGITHGILLRTYVPNRKVEAQKAQQDMYMEGWRGAWPTRCMQHDKLLSRQCTLLCAFLILHNGCTEAHCTPKQMSLHF